MVQKSTNPADLAKAGGQGTASGSGTSATSGASTAGKPRIATLDTRGTDAAARNLERAIEQAVRLPGLAAKPPASELPSAQRPTSSDALRQPRERTQAARPQDSAATPEQDERGRATKAGVLQDGEDVAGSRAGPARQAPVQAMHQRRPANDDRPSIGNLLYSLRRRPSGAPYWTALLISLAWVTFGVTYGWVMYQAEIAALASLGDVFRSPALLTLSAVTLLPVLLFFAIAALIWRAQEMRLMASSMTEVAMRLAEPEDVATDAVASVGQAVRREVAAMGDGVERALARAGELEALVHSEVSALERAYGENELRIRRLIEELIGEREAILSNAQKVRQEISHTHQGLNKDLATAAERIAVVISDASDKLGDIIDTRTAQVTSALANAGDQVTERLMDRSTRIVEALAVKGQEVTSAIGDMSVTLETSLDGHVSQMTSVLDSRLTTMSSDFDTRRNELETTLVNETARFEESISARTHSMRETILTQTQQADELLASRIDRIGGTLDARTGHIITSLDARAGSIGDTLATQADRINDVLGQRASSIGDTLATQADRINDVLGQRAGSIGDTLATQADRINDVLDQRAGSIGDTLATQAARINDVLGQRGSELSETIATRAGAVLKTLVSRSTEIDNTLLERMNSIDAIINVRGHELAQNLSTHASDLNEALARQTATLTEKSAEFSASLTGTSAQIESAIRSHAAELDNTMKTNTQQITDALGSHTQNINDSISSRVDEINQAFAGKAEEINVKLGHQVAGLDELINRDAVYLIERLSERGEEIVKTMEQRGQATIDGFEKVSDTLSRAIISRSSEATRNLAEKGSEIVQALSTKGGEITEALARSGDAVTKLFSERSDEMVHSVTRTNQEIAVNFEQIIDRLTTANRSLQVILSDASSNLEAIEKGLADGADVFRSTIERVSLDAGETGSLVTANVEALQNVSENVLRDISTLALRFEDQSRALRDAASSVDESNERMDSALRTRHEALAGLMLNLNSRSGDVDEMLRSFTEMVETSLTKAETRALEVSRLLGESASQSSQLIQGEYERLHATANTESAHSIDVLRSRYDAVRSEMESMLADARSRFEDMTSQMHGATKQIVGELQMTRDELRRGVLDLPEETRQATSAMRQLVSDQIRALDELSSIVTKQARPAPQARPAQQDLRAPAEAAPIHREPPRREPPRQAPAREAARREHAPQPAPQQAKWSLPDLLARASQDEDAGSRAPDMRAGSSAPARAGAGVSQNYGEPRNGNGNGRQPLHIVESLNSLSVDLARALDHEAPGELWERYQRGERNVFTRRIYTLRGQRTFDEIRGKYSQDSEFRRTVDRYVDDFEKLLENIAVNDRDNMLTQTYLTSDTGKVYLMLAHASGRFEQAG